MSAPPPPDRLPDWIPAQGVELLPCGRSFDAVRLPVFAGMRVINRLRDGSGPVIEDQVQDTLHWLVTPCAADSWHIPGALVLGRGHVLAVPPAHWRAGLWTTNAPTRWLIPPTATCLTHPEVLRAALGHILGPASVRCT